MLIEWTGVGRRRARRKAVDQTVILSLSGGAAVTPAQREMFQFSARHIARTYSDPVYDFDLSFDELQTIFACRLVWRPDAFAEMHEDVSNALRRGSITIQPLCAHAANGSRQAPARPTRLTHCGLRSI
jgi:hypothetical protein